MSDDSYTVTIEGEAARRLAELAELSGRSRDWYVNYVLVEYAERELSILRSLKAAIKNADEGHVVPHDEAKRRLRAAIDSAAQTAAE